MEKQKSPPFAYYLVHKGIKEEIEHYKKIIQISNDQETAIVSGKIDLLNRLINEKETLIKQIDKIENKISPARNILKDRLAELPQKSVINLKKIHSMLQTTMEEVRNKDSNSLNVIIQLKNNIENRITTLRGNNNKICSTYLDRQKLTKNIHPCFFDKKG